MWINIQCVYLPRIVLDMYCVVTLGITRAQPCNIVGKDATVGTGGKHHVVAMPFDISYIQLVRHAVGLWPRHGARRDPCADIDALAKLELSTGRVVQHHGLEDVGAAQCDASPIRRDIEAGYRYTGDVGGILGFRGSVGGGDRGRAATRDARGVGGRGGGVGEGAAEELAHDGRVAVVHLDGRGNRAEAPVRSVGALGEEVEVGGDAEDESGRGTRRGAAPRLHSDITTNDRDHYLIHYLVLESIRATQRDQTLVARNKTQLTFCHRLSISASVITTSLTTFLSPG